MTECGRDFSYFAKMWSIVAKLGEVLLTVGERSGKIVVDNEAICHMKQEVYYGNEGMP